jgi:Holliday junction resolvase RusA-like endonuclease
MNALKIIVPVEPVGKPRMTQRDKWVKRDCVLRYYRYKDNIRIFAGGRITDDYNKVSWKAYFTMPESWSNKKKDGMRGEYHMVKPDRDNIDKGILDALFRQDSHVCAGTLEKFWDDGKGARLEIETEILRKRTSLNK